MYQGSLSVNITENMGYIIEAIIKGIFLLSRNHIDVIHSNTYAPILAGYICSTIFRKPHVITFHDVYLLGRSDFWLKWAKQDSTPRLTSLFGPIFERLSLRLPTSVIHTVSETSKKDLILSNAKAPIVVIPNTISLEDYNSSEVKDFHPCQAIYIGRLVFYKNLETVIKAFRDVCNEIPEARLVIVGDGPYRTHLQCVAKDLSNVVFVGRVSNEEKVKLLKESSFLVFPSLVEGFGIVILEAFSCQKPVLVSNTMPLPEIVDDGLDGFTIPPFESTAWAYKMLRLFTNPAQACEMGLKGYEKLAKRYTIERVVDKLEELYRLVILGRT